jgi:hypothetical protein
MRIVGLTVVAGVIASSALAADISMYEVPDQTPFVPAPPVQRTVLGHIDVFAGIGSVYDEDFDYATYGGGGRVNIPLGDLWNLQLDPQGMWINETGDDGFSNVIEGFAHFYRRTPDGAHGFYLGYTGTNYFGERLNSFTGGLEGQKYWANNTLYGQASLSRHNVVGGSYPINSVMLRGELQHFFSDNTMISGDLIWNHFWNSFDAANVFTVALNAIHRFDGTHVGIWGQVRHDSFNFGSGNTFNNLVGMLGLRAFFDPDGSTVRSHLQTGPAMNVQPMPAFWPEDIEED